MHEVDVSFATPIIEQRRGLRRTRWNGCNQAPRRPLYALPEAPRGPVQPEPMPQEQMPLPMQTDFEPEMAQPLEAGMQMPAERLPEIPEDSAVEQPIISAPEAEHPMVLPQEQKIMDMLATPETRNIPIEQAPQSIPEIATEIGLPNEPIQPMPANEQSPVSSDTMATLPSQKSENRVISNAQAAAIDTVQENTDAEGQLETAGPLLVSNDVHETEQPSSLNVDSADDSPTDLVIM